MNNHLRTYQLHTYINSVLDPYNFPFDLQSVLQNVCDKKMIDNTTFPQNFHVSHLLL